jgi:hypothetical protein
MLQNSQVESKQNAQIIHDINSSLQALVGAVEVMKDEWQSNPELVDKILPLTVDKLHELHRHLQKYRRHHS